jgi:hypothetical protein
LPWAHSSILRLGLALAPLAATGCGSPGRRASFGLAPSLLPNVGLAASLALPLEPPAESEGRGHVELRFTDQFVDDKTFADDGDPEAGNWTQLDLGWIELPPSDTGGWSFRAGLTGFRARGEPNLVEESGDYVGVYVGAGRFTTLGPDWLFGPELALIVATGPDDRVVIPQITWGPRWAP